MERQDKVKCKLVGEDGNIFNLIGLARRALKKAGKNAEADELSKRITADGEARNYDEALLIILEYVEEGE